MKATTLLLFQHRRIQTLVDAAAKSRDARDEHTLALTDAVTAHLATEEAVLYPVVEREMALDMSLHRAAHVRARLALFRLATASSEGFAEDLAHLDRVMREHALSSSALVRALEDHMSDAGLIRLGQRMNDFERRLRQPRAPVEQALAS